MVELQEKEKELRRLSKKIEKNYEIMDQKARTLPTGQAMPETGGYNIPAPKKEKLADQEIKRLKSVLKGQDEIQGFLPAITTSTTMFPLMNLKPGQYPEDAIRVNEQLPPQSVVLKMHPPISPALNSKYIVYFYAPAGYKTRWG